MGMPFRSWFLCCCLIWLRDGRGWGPAVSVSFAQSSTSLCKSSVNVRFLLLLLLVWAWASVVNGWGSGTGMRTGDRADCWLDAELTEVVPLQCDDPMRNNEKERDSVCEDTLQIKKKCTKNMTEIVTCTESRVISWRLIDGNLSIFLLVHTCLLLSSLYLASISRQQATKRLNSPTQVLIHIFESNMQTKIKPRSTSWEVTPSIAMH